MGCTVVVGGFWGDEGKGKIVSYLGLKDKIDICVRTGSVNAAHTIHYNGKRYALHMVPSTFVYDRCRLLIGTGANIHIPQLLKEIEETQVNDRLGIDKYTSLIEAKHSEIDRNDSHSKHIGTTGWGVGPAIQERAGRTAKLACESRELKPYLTNVVDEVTDAIENQQNILLEGTQGLMLSLFFGSYPYVTSRDTSASAVCSEAGVGPCHVDTVIVVYKAFITRVGGGELPGEIPRDEAIRLGWFETAAGTGRERRSAPFDFHLAKRVAQINSATEVAITKLDILYPETQSTTNYNELSHEATNFIERIEQAIKVPVTLIGTGPDTSDVIDRRT
jgi:adenylosuccinate synthase